MHTPMQLETPTSVKGGGDHSDTTIILVGPTTAFLIPFMYVIGHLAVAHDCLSCFNVQEVIGCGDMCKTCIVNRSMLSMLSAQLESGEVTPHVLPRSASSRYPTPSLIFWPTQSSPSDSQGDINAEGLGVSNQ